MTLMTQIICLKKKQIVLLVFFIKYIIHWDLVFLNEFIKMLFIMN